METTPTTFAPTSPPERPSDGPEHIFSDQKEAIDFATTHPADIFYDPSKLDPQPHKAAMVEAAVRSFIKQDRPDLVLDFCRFFLDYPFEEECIRLAAKKDPSSAFFNAHYFGDRPYAGEVLLDAAERSPGNAIFYAPRFIDHAYAERVILTAIIADPESTARMMGIIPEGRSWKEHAKNHPSAEAWQKLAEGLSALKDKIRVTAELTAVHP